MASNLSGGRKCPLRKLGGTSAGHGQFLGWICAQVDFRALKTGMSEPQRHLPYVSRSVQGVHCARVSPMSLKI